MNIIQRMVGNLIGNHPNKEGMTFDISQMPLEDAVLMMMMLLSSDARKDMKDILADMEKTRIKRRAIRAGSEIMKNADKDWAKDLAGNPIFANAIKDVEADIAKQKDSMRAHRAAAAVDQGAAEALLIAAQKDEKDANTLEQPVGTDDNKNRSTVPLILSGVLVLFIIVAVFIKFVLIAPPITPTVPPVAGPSGPADGTLMAWVDGNTLTLCNVLGGSLNHDWIYRSEVSNYQFSLCVAAGACSPPSDQRFDVALGNPGQANLPAQYLNSRSPEEYCAWAQGRLPTEEQRAKISVCSGIGGSETPNGFRCIVDNPRPMALYCKTSAYYDPTKPMEKLDAPITPKGNFCQNGKSYVTLDVALNSTDKLQSVIPQGRGEDCQVVNGNRIVCGGASNSSTNVIAGFLCNGMTGIVDNGGSHPVAGMDDWELNPNGALIPLNGIQLPGDGLMSRSFTPNFVFINGVMVAQSLSGNALSSNGITSNSLSGNGLPSNGLPGNGTVGNGKPSNGGGYPVCPPGYYFDNGTQSCISLALPADATCLAGYKLDKSNLCCSTSTPNGNYPGCPAGQILDPKTGQCDSQTTLISPTSLLHTQSFDLTFPDCSASSSGGDKGDGCPAGKSYICSGIKSITCGCK